MTATEAKTDHYTVISTDTHAGASHATYREYLDPKWHEEFDAWRGKYKNPYKDLGDQRRLRNWDNEMRNHAQWVEEGVVGEVIYPNTVPPFFPSFVLFAGPPPPEEYEKRRAGIQAHNRWLKDFCDEFPTQRAGVGQIFLNDVDDAIEDALWCKENGLRGGILLPNPGPDVTWVRPIYDPCYDPLWKVLAENEIPVNCHGGTGNPNYGKHPFSMLIYINEVGWYSQRPLIHMMLSGVFERHPAMKFVLAEIGASWIPGALASLDNTIKQIASTGETGEIKYDTSSLPTMLASEQWEQNCYIACAFPGDADMAARHTLGIDKFMWGSDYPHDEGTHPYTKDHLRRRFATVPHDECTKILSENAAKLYGFDLDALAPLATEYGLTRDEMHTMPDGPDQQEMKVIGDDMDTAAL